MVKNPSFFILGALILASVQFANAQQPGKVPRIGYLTGTYLSAMTGRVEAFRQGLRDLGYVEGRNIVIEWRSGEGKRERLPELVAELIRLKVDVIVTGGSSVTRRAKEATSTIPIIMTQDRDPVGSGFVASLARPGGNITGLSNFAPELNGKRLELLREIIPRLSLLAFFGTSTNPGNEQELIETERVAGALGVKLQSLDVLGPKDIESAFQSAVKARADAALWRVSGPVYNFRQTQVFELAVKNRLPVIYNRTDTVEAGGLISYGAGSLDLDRRAATYVDKILKGAKPADLPVEQPTKFELIINLKTAKQIGLTIPETVLYRADKVIR
jgi:putative tryptophan/tyrosine transport system substrate-binding protein